MALTDKLTAIGDAIRAKLGGLALIPLADMPTEVGNVYDAGKQAEYDAFWDAYQDNGNLRNYDYAFAGLGWNDTTFKPKYPIVATYGNGMFYLSNISAISVINFANASSLYAAFRSAKKLATIEKLILSSTTNQTFTLTFEECNKLKNIVIEGVIKNSIDIHWSPLTKASITSIINALSATTTGRTVTISQTAKNNAFTAEEWAALVATKPNWTIALS